MDIDLIAQQLLDLAPRLMRVVSVEAQASAEAPLSPPQLRALGLLASRPHLPSELAREMHITPATVSELADVLVRKGLVDRREQPEDRRCTSLVLTDAGNAQYSGARQRALLALRSLLTQLEDGTLVGLGAGLEAILVKLRSRSTASRP